MPILLVPVAAGDWELWEAQQVYTWLGQEETDWPGTDEEKGREECWHCGAEDAAEQLHSLPASSNRPRLTPHQDRANFKVGRKRYSSELIFPCRSYSAHYSGRYLSSSCSSLVVQC